VSHYYTTDDTPHEFSEIKFSFNDHIYRFKTDRGVFSKNQIDYGTEVLIKTVFSDFEGGGKFIDMGAGYGPDRYGARQRTWTETGNGRS
jgi:16S RNA G1207 methylase RsmC